MPSRQRAASPRWCLVALTVALFVFAVGARAAHAATTAGTAITETATATYTDAANNPYTATGNTVTTYVQNVPTLTITDPSVQNVTPAEIVVGTLVLTNTGNNSGTFALTGAATFGGTASVTLQGFVLAGASSGTCSVATPCTYTTLNSQGGMGGIAINGTVTVGVEYKVSTSATTGQTVQPSITANLTYAAATGITSQTSSNITNTTYTDTLITEARLDIQASATTPGSSGANITWTVVANNGGGAPAGGLAAAQNMFGGGGNWLIIYITVPSINGTYLTVSAASGITVQNATAGYSSGITYNTSPCASANGTANWSGTFSTAKCIAFGLYNGTTPTNILPSAPTGSTGAGSVTTSTAQLTFDFITNQPPTSIQGAGGANSVTMLANSSIGGNPWATGAVPVVGQGVAVGAEQDASSYSLLAGIMANATASSGTTPPGGASNVAGSNAFETYAMQVGPLNLGNATGSYPASPNLGSAAADTSHDFEADSFICANGNSINNGSTLCTVAAGGVSFPETIANQTTGTDTYNITAKPPTGWKAQIFSVTSCPTPTTTFPGACSGLASISALSTAGTAVSVTTPVSLAASTNYNFVVTYTAASGVTPFVAANGVVTVTGTTGTETNNTYDDIYPGGVMDVTITPTVSSTHCPAGASPGPPAGTVCPGGVIQYATAYANVVPVAMTTHIGTEPAWAYADTSTQAGTFVITEDGSVGNWSTNSFGLNAAPTDTTGSTTYVYSNGTAFASGSYPSITAGYTKFTATVGGASHQMMPGASGTITFNVTVK